MGAAVEAVVFPPACAACGEPLAIRSAVGLCAACHEGLEANDGARCARCDLPGLSLCARCERQPPPFARARAPYLYGGALSDLLIQAKFHGRLDLAHALAELLALDAEALAIARGASYLVPLPLGRSRRLQRGYNQSAVIARHLARRAGAPLRHVLRRVRDTRPQSELGAADRADNVRAAFTARAHVAGRVVLIDDVVTSTETVRAAAAALRAAGAAEVSVLAPLRRPLEL